MIPKRPDGDWSTMGYSPNGATKETRIPEFVWDTCHFCGGEEAEKTEVYVEHLQAVAKRAVELLRRYSTVDAYGWWHDREYCDDLSEPAKEVIAEIEASGWQP
jgi:hypothetical protein